MVPEGLSLSDTYGQPSASSSQPSGNYFSAIHTAVGCHDRLAAYRTTFLGMAWQALVRREVQP